MLKMKVFCIQKTSIKKNKDIFSVPLYDSKDMRIQQQQRQQNEEKKNI